MSMKVQNTTAESFLTRVWAKLPNTKPDPSFIENQVMLGIYDQSVKSLDLSYLGLTHLPHGLSYFQKVDAIDLRGNAIPSNEIVGYFKNTHVTIALDDDLARLVTYRLRKHNKPYSCTIVHDQEIILKNDKFIYRA
ncbi:MAG: hypothetical protein V4494_07470 [Chlamydiota bacterium]